MMQPKEKIFFLLAAFFIFFLLFFISHLFLLKTVDIRSPKTVISVHFSSSKPMAMQIY